MSGCGQTPEDSEKYCVKDAKIHTKCQSEKAVYLIQSTPLLTVTNPPFLAVSQHRRKNVKKNFPHYCSYNLNPRSRQKCY